MVYFAVCTSNIWSHGRMVKYSVIWLNGWYKQIGRAKSRQTDDIKDFVHQTYVITRNTFREILYLSVNSSELFFYFSNPNPNLTPTSRKIIRVN